MGKPDQLRVDNGHPLSLPKHDIPSALALCLKAYGIHVKTNRAKIPQDNGVVERFQGTSKRWSEILSCHSLTQAQQQLNQTLLIQREQYPVTRLNNMTRSEAFPTLFYKKHCWSSNDFDLERIYKYLEGKAYVRSTSKAAQITHFGQKQSIGAKWRNKDVYVSFDRFTLKWIVNSTNGDFIKALPAFNLSKDRIQNMTVFSKNF